MSIFTQAYQKSAELRTLASKEQLERWEAAPHQLLQNPDLARKILGIMARLTVTPEVIEAKARNYLEEAGVIHEISEPIGAYKQHILMSIPQAADPQFMDIWNKSSVDQQRIWKTEDREYFQDLGGLAIQVPITLSETEFREAFATLSAMENVLSAKRNAVVTAYSLNMLYSELDCVSKAINDTTFPRKPAQDITLSEQVDLENMSDAAYKELLKVVRAIKFNLTHYFTGEYNAAGYATMHKDDDLIMLVRGEIAKYIGVDLLFSAYNKDELGFDIPLVPVPNFGGLAGFVPTYNAEGQQTKALEDSETITDPNEDVLAVITTKRYFVKNTKNPFVVESAPYNARGKYISMYGNYLGGITGIAYEPFFVIKKPTI